MRSKECRLLERRQLTCGTNPVLLLRFELPKDTRLGNRIFESIAVSATIKGKSIRRWYTPCSSNLVKGYFELMVKVYPKGKMGNHLARLPIGKSVTIQKPSGRFDYQSTNVNHIGIIAGGVGIAPFICLLEYVIRSHPRVQVSVLFANQTKEDIILQKQLCQWSEENPNIELHFVLSRPDQTWNGLSGHINQHIIRECMPSPELDPLVVICGPSNMTQVATESLNSLGYCNYRVV